MATQQDPLPRLLLVEDDPISNRFLTDALRAVPATVDGCASQAAALALAAERSYDLALIDVNLPDGDAPALLDALRQRHPGLPALAHTADLPVQTRRALDDRGFLDVLVKPMSVEQLLKAVRRGLRHAPRPAAPVVVGASNDWDESAALRALNGQQAHLNALRELFLAELPATRDAVDSALGRADEQTARSHLHRLQASCGFVGAARLARAVRQLHGEPGSSLARDQFHQAVAALLH